MLKKLSAEAIGTFWLVFGGCGSAVLAASFPELGIGFAGVALAFGLSVLSVAYVVSHIGVCHFNPAVSVGLAVAGRFPWGQVPAYVAAQCAGGLLGAAVLYGVASDTAGFVAGAFASNGYGELSPGGYGIRAAFLVEVVTTAALVLIVLGATSKGVADEFAPVAIGLGLTVIHLISIPITNTSVNPARSLAVAFFADTGAVGQLWLFWVAPLLGAAAGGLVWTSLLGGSTMAAAQGPDDGGADDQGADDGGLAPSI